MSMAFYWVLHPSLPSELYNLFISLDLISFMIKTVLRWNGHVLDWNPPRAVWLLPAAFVTVT